MGNVGKAIQLRCIVWASLPGSPHGQPTVDKDKIMIKYEEYLSEEKQGKTSLYATYKEINS